MKGVPLTKWIPRGRVFPPAGGALPPWIGGYGSAPFAVLDVGRKALVFFSGRDEQNRGSIGACTLDLDQFAVDSSGVENEPLVVPGPPGAFDESGCTMSCLVQHEGSWFLYYTGWMQGRTVPFYLAVGLAISTDGGRTFRKHSRAPILDRSAVDPFLIASPSIVIENGVWRMWYVSALEWQHGRGGLRHRYLIRYAESRDGVRWERDGRIAVNFESDDEYAMGRPHVIRDGDRYRMWYCVRGDRYRIAYAESSDGFGWKRVDGAAADVPNQEWDSEMQAYPMVLRDRERWILLYNGNGYGATGFGVAVSGLIS